MNERYIPYIFGIIWEIFRFIAKTSMRAIDIIFSSLNPVLTLMRAINVIFSSFEPSFDVNEGY
jgi:hypothetical protein